MELVPGMAISASGLAAERTRIEIAAHNLANAHSTQDAKGNVFQRQEVVFRSVLKHHLGGGTELGGVLVDGIVSDSAPPKELYRPGHPHADDRGMLKMPNVQPMTEMVDIMTASRAYEANLAVLKQSRDMARDNIDLLRS